MVNDPRCSPAIGQGSPPVRRTGKQASHVGGTREINSGAKIRKACTIVHAQFRNLRRGIEEEVQNSQDGRFLLREPVRPPATLTAEKFDNSVCLTVRNIDASEFLVYIGRIINPGGNHEDPGDRRHLP
jgi:hypothetical protein